VEVLSDKEMHDGEACEDDAAMLQLHVAEVYGVV
jgi:hypothetical protein